MTGPRKRRAVPKPQAVAAAADDVRLEVSELYRRIYDLERRLSGGGENAAPNGPFEALSCRVGNDPVLIRLDEVREVVPRPTLAELPEAPAWVPGLMNLRGDAIPVIDALARAERRPRTADVGDLIVVCALSDRTVGIVVQAVFDVLHLDGADLQTSFGDVALAPYVTGSILTETGAALLLSIERLLRFTNVPEAAVAEMQP